MELSYSDFKGKCESLEVKFFKPVTLYKDDILTIIEEPFSEVSYYPDYINLKYNKGKKVQEIRKNVGSNSYLQTNYIYNELGLLQEINIPEQNNFYIQYKFIYNESGKKISENKFEYGNLKWTNFYHYDNNGFLIKEEWRSRDFPLIDFIYVNNSKGNVLHKTGKYLLGQIETFEDTKFDYNQLSLCIKRKTYNEEEIFKYDNNKNIVLSELTRIIDFDKSIFNLKKILTYDNLGNILKYIEYRNDIIYNQIEWKYSFDNHQNWIKVIQINDNKPEVVITRSFL